MKKRRSLIAALLTLLLVVGLFYSYYNQPRKDVNGVEAAYFLTSESLYTDFVNNEARANEKYVNKVIAVSGVVKEVTIDSVTSLILSAGNENGGINCSFKNNSIKTFRKGKMIVIKGICTGFLLDVNLVDVVVVNAEGE